MKSRTRPLLLALALVACGEAREPAAPSVEPPEARGLLANGAGATPGYVLFNPLLSDTTYLIDNAGRVVHTWRSAYSPGGDQNLLDDGSLLRLGRDPELLSFKAGGVGGWIERLAWDGTVAWSWHFASEEAVLHHDVKPLPNGNLLALAWEVKTRQEALAAGRRPQLIPEQGVWPDWVLEVEPLPGNGARIVWEWHAWDHLVQDSDRKAPHYGKLADRPERIDVNAGPGERSIDPQELEHLKALGYVPEDARPQDLESDFLHINALDYHAGLDQIALSVPQTGEVWLIDRGTSRAEAASSAGGRRGRGGDLLYRWGNPSAYGRGDAAAQRFFYQHDVRWIPAGWPGTGNLTVFNNGMDKRGRGWSSVDEIAPPLAADGRYPLAPGVAWGPSELVWSYAAPERGSFYAPFISGAQRLANGNTFVCSGPEGRLFEVTPAGQIVWEYANPFSGGVRNVDGSPPQPGLRKAPYAVFRATRIPADHPALAGRALRPLDPQPEPRDTLPPRETQEGV